jgi:hypothetical protein
MGHQRLANELRVRLARGAVRVVAPHLPDEALRETFAALFAAFEADVDWFEAECERMRARLAPLSQPRRAKDEVERRPTTAEPP